jgi:DNA-binding beta-propeller fold protein YncE
MLRLAAWLVLGWFTASATALAQGRPQTQDAQPDATAGGPGTKADLNVATYSTTGRDGSWSRVDLIPVFQGNPTLGPAPSLIQQALLDALQTLAGTDLNGDWSGPTPTLPTSGFDAYTTGLPTGSLAGMILGANNLYDLLQSTTGKPQNGGTLPPEFNGVTFPGFTGGDLDGHLLTGDAEGEGGPGLFSNFPSSELPAGRAVPPRLPTLPNTMGGAAGTSGRGPQPDDEHQFIQVVFSYRLDRDSLFNPAASGNSFLGDNVAIVAHSIQHPPGDALNVVDQPAQHVPGIAVIGGVSAIPTGLPSDLPQFAYIDPQQPTFNRIPTGARQRIMAANVLTYVAHEAPQSIVAKPFPQPASSGGYIVDQNGTDGAGTNAGLLILPSPTAPTGQGGRVFGATPPVVGSVNDFLTDGDDDAAAVGFMSIEIAWLRTQGELVRWPYFHSLPFDQDSVGQDPRAVGESFNRGAAITVSAAQVPSIDVLDPATDAIGPYDPQPASDAINTISTRARFRVDFDREVVPNSVGFSRRHTLHGTAALGVIFPFNGNTRPIQDPSSALAPGLSGSPLAPSLYLAVNQPAGVNLSTGLVQPVASPYQVKGAPPVDAAGNFLADDGVTPVDAEANGLTPEAHNQLATLPRGIVPVDIHPLNQNNLQAYVVEPLIDLPPGTIVTLGVAMNGLGTTFYGLVNHGNHTRSGTLSTPYQALDPTTGLGEDASLKQAVLANHTVIKVNAGPMSLDGLLFHGGTNVALQRRVNGDPVGPDDLTTGGFNVNRSFRVGTDNSRPYVNAPVCPQALYLAFAGGGAGVLDLSGNGYTTNAPGGGLENPLYPFTLESSRFLPAVTQALGAGHFNWVPGGSAAAGDHRRAFGILGRYTSGSGGLPGNIESDLAVGAPITTGALTPQPGVNEGSSGYDTLVRTGIVEGDPRSASVELAPAAQVGFVTDIEVGDFLDTVYFDPENPWTLVGHSTYNSPLLGAGLDNNTIADPPTPNPPPLRLPVGLPATAVLFDQNHLRRPPLVIEGHEVFSSDSVFAWQSGAFIHGSPQPVNGLIFLNPVGNPGNPTSADQPHLPNAGFQNTFVGITAVSNPAYVQTGPPPKTSTGAGVVLAEVNLINGPGFANPSGLVAPYYQSRQQIGNFLFLADGVNNEVHALNSNTMEILHSVALPDPYGLGLTPDLRRLFVSNEGDSSVSIVDADPTSSTFMTELKRTPVGSGPRAVACNPDREDVFVLNYAGNTISILDQASGVVRKTLTAGVIDRPYDMAVGMREYPGAPAFQSGTYHGYVSNFGGDNVLVYESGPDGLAGIGFDDLIDVVTSDPPTPSGQRFHTMRRPRGITFDPDAPLDGFNRSIGCYVAHEDDQGVALVSRIAYTQDFLPGVNVFNTTLQDPLASADKVFEVTAQYVSSLSGPALDVALPDYNRQRFEQEDYGSYYNLVNAGATSMSQPDVEPNWKFPLADTMVPFIQDGPRWEPDRLYLSVGGAQPRIEVFDLVTGQQLHSITTPREVGVLTGYFGQ